MACRVFFELCFPAPKLEALTNAEDKNHLHPRPGDRKNGDDSATDLARSRRLSFEHESRATGMGAGDCSANPQACRRIKPSGRNPPRHARTSNPDRAVDNTVGFEEA